MAFTSLVIQRSIGSPNVLAPGTVPRCNAGILQNVYEGVPSQPA